MSHQIKHAIDDGGNNKARNNDWQLGQNLTKTMTVVSSTSGPFSNESPVNTGNHGVICRKEEARKKDKR